MSFFSTLGGNLLGPWRLYAELAVVGGLAAGVGTQTWRLHSSEADEATAKTATAVAKGETKDVRAQWAIQAAAGASAAAAATEKVRLLTAQLQQTKDEADHAAQIEHTASARTAAAFAAERAGLRDQLVAYAAGPADRGGITFDTVAACRVRAASLGSGLDGSLQTEEDLTGELEDSRADTRRLLHAWPRATVKP